MDAKLAVTGHWTIRDSVIRRQATFAEYVAGTLIYKMCTGVERTEGSSKFLRWWNQ